MTLFDVLWSRLLFDLAQSSWDQSPLFISLYLSYILGEDRNWLLTTESADQTVNITINQD